jgi:hypothetical protein
MSQENAWKQGIAYELGNILSLLKTAQPFIFNTLKTNVNSTQNLATLLINLPELEIHYFTVYCFTVYFTDVTSLIGFIVISRRGKQQS